MFEDLGFAQCIDVRGSTSIARHFVGADHCGIYILHFANGEYYVGQAINVARRFLEHSRNYPDIERISFRTVAQPRLNTVEENVVQMLESRGFHLRNIQIVNMTYGATEFDSVMSPVEQQRWLADHTFSDGGGPRRIDESFRARYRQRLPLYQQMPNADAVTHFAARYVQSTVPAARRGERDFWSVSCRPYPRLYLRLNINSMEVLTVYSDVIPIVSFHVTRSNLAEMLRQHAHPWVRFARGPHFDVIDQIYKPGGTDQVNIQCRLRDAELLLDDACFLAAARTMNLRLMRKGLNLNARSHAYDLADLLLPDVPISI